MEERANIMEDVMQIHCSTHSVILNATATQYTCSLKGIYHPLLTSTVKLSLFSHAHSSLLSSVARLHRCCANILVILTMPGFFSGQTSYSLPTQKPPPSLSTSPMGMVHLLRDEPTLLHIIISRSPQFTYRLSLGVLPPVGLDKSILTCIYHYNII